MMENNNDDHFNYMFGTDKAGLNLWFDRHVKANHGDVKAMVTSNLSTIQEWLELEGNSNNVRQQLNRIKWVINAKLS